MINCKRLKIVVTVPPEHADAIRAVLGDAGAGLSDKYGYCSFSVVGAGRFRPNEQAHPYIGKRNELATVSEERIEVICERDQAKQIVAALRAAHPYEEPAIDIYPLLDEDEL